MEVQRRWVWEIAILIEVYGVECLKELSMGD